MLWDGGKIINIFCWTCVNRNCLCVACCLSPCGSSWASPPTSTCLSPPFSTRPAGAGVTRPPCRGCWPTCCGPSMAPLAWCVRRLLPLPFLPQQDTQLSLFFFTSLRLGDTQIPRVFFCCFTGKDRELCKPRCHVKVSCLTWNWKC